MKKSELPKLVWSDDPKDRAALEKKPAPAAVDMRSSHWVAIFRIEKNGRGGKVVTVIDGLPKQDQFLNELCKELKSKCGSGGTYSMDGKMGLIEIQGDKRVPIKEIFSKKGYRFKGM